MSTLIPIFRRGRSFPALPPVKARRPFTLKPGRPGRRSAFAFVSAPPTRTPS